VAALSGKLQISALISIKLGSKSNEFFDSPGTLVYQYSHRIEITQSRSCRERVGQMQIDFLYVAR
jgi:hypothetical protein